MIEITVKVQVPEGKYCEVNGGACNHTSGEMGNYCSIFLDNLKGTQKDRRLRKCPSCLRACAEGKEKGQ